MGRLKAYFDVRSALCATEERPDFGKGAKLMKK